MKKKHARAKHPRLFGGLAADERRAQRREQFILAGIRAFGRDGYAATTTRSICAEAKLTQRYFYESFSGMDDLFVAVCEFISATSRQQILVAVAAAPREPEAMLRAGLTALFRGIDDDPLAARVAIIETYSAHGLALSRSAFQEWAEFILDNFRTLAPNVDLGPVEPRLLAMGLMGATHHIALTWLIEGRKQPVARVVETALVPYLTLIEKIRAANHPPRAPFRRLDPSP